MTHKYSIVRQPSGQLEQGTQLVSNVMKPVDTGDELKGAVRDEPSQGSFLESQIGGGV